MEISNKFKKESLEGQTAPPVGYEWLKPDHSPLMTKSALEFPKVSYTFDEMTAMIQRLERTKKRSGQVKKAKIQIIIDEFKQYRKEIE